MRHSSALNYNQGFTILESILVMAIVAIVAAFAAPSFLAWYQQDQVNSAITDIEGAIKESQRQAIAKSQTCNITFDTANAEVVSTANNSASPPINDCLITGDRTLEGVEIESSTAQFNFSFEGNTVESASSTTELTSPVIVVVKHDNNDNLKKCLVVSAPLGLITTGEYTGNGTVLANCNP